MKKIGKYIKANILEIICIILLTIYSFSIIEKEFQNDTFFSIITGNYILKNGINDVEPFTIHDNLIYIKLRWLFDIIIAIIYNNFGFYGLYYFVIVIVITLAISLFEILKKYNKNSIISFFITFMVMNYLKSYLVCRAQIISYFLFCWEIYFFESYLKKYDRKYKYLLLMDSILLVNFHSSVWLVFFLPFFTVFGENILYYIKINKLKIFKNIIFKKYDLSKILQLFVICLISGIISPLKLSPYTYIFKVMKGFSKEFIIELMPLDILNIHPFNYIILIFIIIIFFTNTKIQFKDILSIFGYLLMSKLAVRNSYIAIIFLGFYFEKIFLQLLEQYDLTRLIYSTEKKLSNNILAQILFLGIILSFCKSEYQKRQNEVFVPIYDYPIQAVNYIKENLDINNIRIYNSFNYGSYIEFNGIKAFIDSRSEIYCEEFSNVTILKDWYKAENQNNDYIKDIMVKYNITHFLLYIDSPERKVLDSLDNVELLYKDEFFCIYQCNN